ncbi:phosphorylase family protein [Streptomyces sp. NPDC002845]
MVILTALKVEYEAVYRHFSGKVEQHRDASGTVFGCGLFADTGWFVLLAHGVRGNTKAALVAQQAKSTFSPDALFFVGVAGALSDGDEVRLGDVVVGTKIYNYEGTKEESGDSYSRPEAWPAPPGLSQAAQRMNERGIGFAVHHKPIASGDKVLNDRSSKEFVRIRRGYNDAVAVDMESAGVAAAAYSLNLPALAIRGISDLADGRKGEADARGSQPLAAAHAATVAVEILKEYGTGHDAEPGSGISGVTPPGSGTGGVQGPGTTGVSVLESPPENPPVSKTELTEAHEATKVNGENRATKADSSSEEKSADRTPRTPPAGNDSPPRLPPWASLTNLLGKQPKLRLLLTALPTFVVALIVVLLWTLLSGGGEGADGGNTTRAAPTLPECPVDEADLTLRIATSVDLSKALREAAVDYGARLSGDKCVKVAVDDVNSGDGARALGKGWTEDDGPRPDVWSPAGNDWLALARSYAEDNPAALKRLPETAEPIVTSPLTIAMPEPAARYLGWREQRIGWRDLADWSKESNDFWVKRGKQWGDFKLGKTNPNYSTSGLNATVGIYYAGTGTSRELSVKDIAAPDNKGLVEDIERSVVHYGDTTLTFLANLREADDSGGEAAALEYISAVTVEEAAVVAYNKGYPCGSYSDGQVCARTSEPTTKLMALYPKGSNPGSNHPYIQLKGVEPAKQAVSEDFLRYVHAPAVYEKYFEPYGFRTHKGTPGRSVTEDNGALPDTELSAYAAPSGPVLGRIQQVWSELRRPANVLVVIDTSGSMDDDVPGTGKTKMEMLKEAEPALFGGFGDRDRVGLWKFANKANLDGQRDYLPLVPIGPLGGKLPENDDAIRSEELTKQVGGLVPNGGTGLYATLDAAVDTMRTGYDPNAINAIVLLTDGRNEVNYGPTKDEVLSRIGDPEKRVRVFTIAYGDDADEQDKDGKSVLEEIATATGARAYDAKDASTINEVLTSVISNF